MLVSAILVFVTELLLCSIIPSVTLINQSHVLAIIGLVLGIMFTCFSAGGIVGSIKGIKAGVQRGKSITALVFFITDVVTGITLFIIGLTFTVIQFNTLLY